MSQKKVAFPRFGNYNLCIKYFVEQALNAEYILQPPLTQRTLEAGARYSPDSVCAPFKTCLGSLIDALEAGADTPDYASRHLPAGLLRGTSRTDFERSGI